MIGAEAASSETSSGEHAAAWEKIEQARAHVAGNPLGRLLQRPLTQRVTSEQVDIAIAWLDDMRLREGQCFTDVVSHLLPALDEAIAATEGERKADLLAHRGWADFLRSRDSGQQFAPESYYRQALEAGLKRDIADAVAEGRRPAGMAEDEEIVYDFLTELNRSRVDVI